MLKQFNRFIILGLVVAVAVYVTITNSAPATIHLGGSSTITASAGVLYLTIFALGCLCASLVALLWGVKAYFRERRLRIQVRTHTDFTQSLGSGIGLMAMQEWGPARDCWEDILASDPTNTLARIELSHCLENLGDNSEALRVIDSARAQGAATTEILMRGYELNKAQGNLVGAKDNLVLLAQKHPSQHVLISLRELHLALRGYNEALQIQDKLESLGFRDYQEENPRAANAVRRIN
jgi:tetratricopeptide (TPR) repeat protein